MIDPAWVALSLTKHLGGKTFRALLQHFNHDLHAILNASPESLRQVRGVGAKIANAVQSIDLERTVCDLERWQRAGVRVIPWDHDDYPLSLRAIDDAPPTLFVLGQWKPRTGYAVVGTRTPTPESQALAAQISANIVQAGHMVISGLAMGVDTLAHMGALAEPNGLTCAVLGSGVLNIYPPSNRGLAQAILGRGALLCEVTPEMTVAAPGLVARNRIITGLSEALIVVQTEIDGGAMHAVRFAKIQGKPIYAVDNAASGNRQLIAEGAIALSLDLHELRL